MINQTPEKPIMHVLVSIQSDEHNILRLDHVEHLGGTPPEDWLSLYMHDDADYGKTFVFADAHEARTFFKRALAEVEKFI